MRRTTTLLSALGLVAVMLGLGTPQTGSRTSDLADPGAEHRASAHAPYAAQPARSLLHGLVMPAKRAEISAPFEQRIVSIAVREGQRVRAGDELARLDDELVLATLATAEARAAATGALAAAQTEVDAAMRTLERVTSLESNGAAGGSELEDAEIDLRRAKARLQSAEETREQARREMNQQRTRAEQHIIRAPFDALIARVEAEVGETHQPEDPVLVLVDLTTLEVEFHLPASMYNLVRTGDEVTLNTSAPADRQLRATLVTIEPIIDPATRTFRCVFEIDNRTLGLPAGFTATLGKADLVRITKRQPSQRHQTPSTTAGVDTP